MQKVPYMLVVGDREAAEGTVSVRSRAGGDLGARPLDDVRRRRAGRRSRPRALEVETPSAAERLRRDSDGRSAIAFERPGMRGPRRDDRVRVNERIRVREIRVIDEAGQQLGIMPPQQALAIARQKGLDLVEVSPTAVPPVCRIMDFGNSSTRSRSGHARPRSTRRSIEVKEIKFRPKVDEHDYQFKKKHIERFLGEGDKVKATMFFRGREIAHPEIGRRILERLIEELAEVAVAETMPRLEGNQMHTILTQRPGLKRPAPAPAAAAAAAPAAPALPPWRPADAGRAREQTQA